MFERFLPARDLLGPHAPTWSRDLPAALAVAFLAVPQGVAYALIAGLPPAMGLYAGALPAIVGSLARSSRQVISGPTNALSLLVGTAVAAQAGDPVRAAMSLALMVGLIQVLAGLLNLGALVDYLSGAVVLGYITGAAVLIAVGQLPNLSATPGGEGHLYGKISGWLIHAAEADPRTLALALGTAATLLLLKRLAPRVPGAVVAMLGGIGLSWAFDLRGHGMRLLRDLAPVPTGLPPLAWPGLGEDPLGLLPVAVAAVVLSLVESSAVARDIASRTGDRLDSSVEFFGIGLANVAAGLSGAYPVSGSLSRSAVNERSGSTSRLPGVIAGLLMLVVLLVAGPVVDLTPVASLAGLLLVVAWRLIDRPRIQRMLRGSWSDRLAFLTTLLGTFTLRLDQAIYLGVAISLVLFLRRARLMVAHEMRVGPQGRLREIDDEDADLVGAGAPLPPCAAIRIVHLEGSVFFGAAGELRTVLDEYTADEEVRVLILRMKRTHDLDLTTAEVLEAAHFRLAEQGRHLLLVGMRDRAMELLQRTGVARRIGSESLFPTEPRWFYAMDTAVRRALDIVGHADDKSCPLRSYVEQVASASAPAHAEG